MIRRAAIITALHARRREVVNRGCDLLLGRGDVARAARFALTNGHVRRAAMLAEDVLEMGHALPDAFVASLGAGMSLCALTAYPRVWNETMRRAYALLPVRERIARGLLLWNALPGNADASAFAGVAALIRDAYVVLGEWGALSVFEEGVCERLRLLGVTDSLLGRQARELMGIGADVERLDGVCAHRIESVLAVLPPGNPLQARLLCVVVARSHAMRGDRTAERKTFEDALAHAERSGVASLGVECAQAAAIAAWIAGENDLFETYVRAIEKAVKENIALRGVGGHFLDCVRGRGMLAASGHELPAVRAGAWLIAACKTHDRAERQVLFDEAMWSSDQSRDGRMQALVRIAAVHGRHPRADLLQEARGFAKRAGDGELLRLAQGGISVKPERLRGFFERFQGDRERGAALQVSLLTGRVVREGVSLVLSRKEFALLALLAVNTGPVGTDTLVEAFWSHKTGDDHTVGLRVYVNRLRKRLGDPSAILSEQYGYMRGAQVSTDLEEIETFVRGLDTNGGADVIEEAMRRHRLLRGGLMIALIDLPPFLPLHARVNGLLEQITYWLEEQLPRLSVRRRAAVARTLEEIDDLEEANLITA